MDAGSYTLTGTDVDFLIEILARVLFQSDVFTTQTEFDSVITTLLELDDVSSNQAKSDDAQTTQIEAITVQTTELREDEVRPVT